MGHVFSWLFLLLTLSYDVACFLPVCMVIFFWKTSPVWSYLSLPQRNPWILNYLGATHLNIHLTLSHFGGLKYMISLYPSPEAKQKTCFLPLARVTAVSSWSFRQRMKTSQALDLSEYPIFCRSRSIASLEYAKTLEFQPWRSASPVTRVATSPSERGFGVCSRPCL